MKADLDDAPERVRRTNERGLGRVFLAIGTGLVACWALAAWLAKPETMEWVRPSLGAHTTAAPLQEQTPRFSHQLPDQPVPSSAQPAETASPLTAAKGEPAPDPIDSRRLDAPAALPTTRQTSFNDQNYQPRGVVNSLPAPRPVQYAATTRSNSPRGVRRDNQADWKWVGADRKVVPVRIQWQTVDGWIDYDTVCHNHSRGSLLYRDCRKAAKDYFVHRCRTRQQPAFCAAENNFNPL